MSCLLITFSSSSAPASLSRSISGISGRICSWVSSRSCSGVWARTEQNAPIHAGFVLPFKEAQCFAPAWIYAGEMFCFFPGDAPPILLRFPVHRRSRRVLHLEPIRRAAGAIDRVLALRDDAFETKLAGVGEDSRAVALDMLVEPDAGAGLGHDRCERSLADLKRIAPQ